MNARPLSVKVTLPVKKMKYVSGLTNAAADMDTLERAAILSAPLSSGDQTARGSVIVIQMASVMI